MNHLSGIARFRLKTPYLVFAATFALGILDLVRLVGSPSFLPLRGDAHFYDDWAQRILRGEISGGPAFYGLPGYAYLLAFLYKVFGYNIFVPALLQAGLYAGIAVLLYQISASVFTTNTEAVFGATRRFSGFAAQSCARPIGILAALGWALFVPAQAYSVILMPTTWFVFVFWLVVWLVVNDQPRRARQYLLVGLLIGLTATAVATILAIVPLVLAALLLKSKAAKPAFRSLLFCAALFSGGLGIGTAPCWIHNYFVARDPVFLSGHSGINFWIGNHPGAVGYPRFPPGLRTAQAAMLQDSITEAEMAAGHPLKLAEVSAYWSGKAKAYIAGHFGDWLRLLMLKLRNFWNAFQYDDLSIITVLREQGVILPGVSFGLVSALALPGMLLAWQLTPKSRWIVGAILLCMLALLTVFITERYRLVAVPGLLLFAVFGLSVFWEACASNRPVTIAIYLFVLLLSSLFVAWPQRDPSLWALDAYNSGWQALESQNLSLAEKKLAIAYAYVPTNSETNFALGNLKLAQGQNESASDFYRATLTLDPGHRGALNNLGVLALNAGRYEEAKGWLRHAEELDPGNAKTRYLRARAFLGEHDLENARQEIDCAIGLQPGQPEFAKLRRQIVEQ